MKWYETSLNAQFDDAIKLLQQGRSQAYVKAVRRICTLVIERERQVRCDPEMTSAPSHYQGIDALLHMEQSKLRVTTDEDLVISRMGLMCDCAALVLDSDRPESKRKVATAKQALRKISREMERRTNVYNLDDDYWWM